jgi:hypothetical protein
LEFGKDLWNKGQNYDERVMRARPDRRGVKKALEEAVEDGEIDFDAIDVDEVHGEDGDSDWCPPGR